MATSSSDESSTAPRDFYLSSSLDSGSRLSFNTHKCQLCNSPRKKFYCRDCIYKGDFVHSNFTAHLSERFAEKQLKLLKLKGLRKTIEDKCGDHLSRKVRIDDINCKIRQCHDRIKLLRLLVQEKKEKNKANSTRLDEIATENAALSSKLTRYADMVEKIGSYVRLKVEKTEQRHGQLLDVRQKLKGVARARVQQLVLYIFPISKLQPSKSCSDIEATEQNTVSALAEATHTAYIRGRWVFTDSSCELQHSIVAPTLPGSGDYSAYNVWVAENKDSVPSGSSSVQINHNPAYNISAALTYTAQLVNILAFYLDVRLPHKMQFSDFCGSDMSEQQFARRVARLNANVLHLCFSQNVNPKLLNPATTLHNIVQLINAEVSDLGRQGPIETDPELVNSLEGQLVRDLISNDDSDSEEGDTLPFEWEAVPHIQCPEAQAGPATIPSQQMTSTQQATSLVTSAAASLASFWRGWTGK